MRKAYKMFNKDLTCRGFQFVPDKWFEEEAEGGANTARNGFHCAYNPLDCLSYYSSFADSRCFIVEIGGDVDEDAYDSKIAATKMRLVKELDLNSFVAHSLLFVYEHPELSENSIIERDTHRGGADNNFVIVRGKNPKCSAPTGTVVGLLKEAPDSNKIIALDLYISGDKNHRSNTYYTIGGVRA